MFFNDLKRLCLAGMIALCATLHLHAQDTLRLTMPETDKHCLERNLQLMAERFNIDAARALVLQARL